MSTAGDVESESGIRRGGAFVGGLVMLLAILACGPAQTPVPIPQPSTGSGDGGGSSAGAQAVCGDDVCEPNEICPVDCADDELDFGTGGTPAAADDSGGSSDDSGGGGGGAAEEDDSLPASVQGELLWSAGGGGPGPSPEPCSRGLVTYWISTYGGVGLIDIDEHPYKGIGPEEGVQGLTFTVNQCNLAVGTPVDVTFVLPDGQVDRVSTTVASNGQLNVSWISIPGEPEGQYQVDAESGGSGLTMYFVTHRALYPIVRSVCQIPDSTAPHASLTGFEPGERVAVIVYQAVGLLADQTTTRLELHSHQFVTMDDEGRAIVEVADVDGLIVAVGALPDYEWVGSPESVPMPVDGFDSLDCSR